jgi:hypothetical protein
MVPSVLRAIMPGEHRGGGLDVVGKIGDGVKLTEVVYR